MITLRKRAADHVITAYCGSLDRTGQVVRVVGVELGGVIVAPVNPENPEQMPGYGLIVEKLSPTRCVVQRWGDVRLALDVPLEPGKVCYVARDATLTTTQPTPSISGVYVLQTVGLATGVDTLDFSPSPATLEISA